MKLASRKTVLTVLLALFAFGLISCILGGDKVAGRGSEVENEVGLYGVLVDENGKAVPGAKVKALQNGVGALNVLSSTDIRLSSDSTFTDEKGKYSFPNLSSGVYNILGDYNASALVFLKPEIDFRDTKKGLNIGEDTLRKPGSIHGRILLGDRGKEGVLCYVPGTASIQISDDSGAFLLNGVPQGKYSVRYSLLGFVVLPDTGVTVLSGKVTELPSKHLEYDPALPPPAPTNLKASYDTLSESVTLSWDAIPVSDLDGFVVYRDEISSPEPVPLRNGFTRGTVYVDDVFKELNESERRWVTYRVKSKDKDANVSVNFSQPISFEIISKSVVSTTLLLETTNLSDSEATIGDSLKFILHYLNPTHKIVSLTWSKEGEKDPLRISSVNLSNGVDTLKWVANTLGAQQIQVIALDEVGQSWRVKTNFRIIVDPPTVYVPYNVVVSINDTLRINGIASDRIGHIALWEWDVGATGNFVNTENGALVTKLPDTSGRLPCVFRATDDDGNTAVDTLTVIVVLDSPKAVLLLEDTTVSINDTVILRGYGSDGIGKIVKIEWDIGNTGQFVEAKDAFFSFTADSLGETFLPCILRVTDDDGLTDQKTVWVQILNDSPVPIIDVPEEVFAGDTVHISSIRSQDRFGYIVSRRWNIGNNGFSDQNGNIDTFIVAPLVSDTLIPIVLEIKDDDGQISLAQTSIKVLLRNQSSVNPIWTKYPLILPNSSNQNSDPQDYLASSWIFPTLDKVFFFSGLNQEVFSTTNLLNWESVGENYKSFESGSYCFHNGRMWGVSTTDQVGPGFSSEGNFEVQSVGHPYFGPWKSETVSTALNGKLISGFNIISFANKIFLFCSLANTKNKNVIFSSINGQDWDLETSTPEFSTREYFSMSQWKNRLWLYGGRNSDGSKILNDLWSSGDGIHWIKEVDSLPFDAALTNPEIAGIGENLFLFGGTDEYGEIPFTMYSSKDGKNWNTITRNENISRLSILKAFEFSGKIWIYGFKPFQNERIPEIWSATP